MRSSLYFFAALGSQLVQSAPTPTQEQPQVEKRQVANIISEIEQLGSGATPTAGNILNNILTDLELVTATIVPSQVPQAFSLLESALTAQPTPSNLFAAVGNVVAAGLTPDNVVDTLGFVEGLLVGANSETNFNPISPIFPRIYPSAARGDAPYSLSEAQLRAAIYIPPTFRYGLFGAPQPVILVPGTGNTGYTTFDGNIIKLMTGSTVGDPVWLNIPGYQLNDAQLSSEYVSYAVGYISAISQRRKVSLVAWSQGGTNCQWSTKYWPSIRAKINDIVAFSPDYHGTLIASYAATPAEPLPPSLLQQEYNSNYVNTLRSNGGDSAYVTTTTIYSGLVDEIVEPQQGTAASAFLHDARGVGVTNNQVQSVCPGQPAGLFYPHEGTLYNPIGWALLVDALTHPGPGQVSRINKNAVCGNLLTPGLTLADFLLTENTLLVAGLAILTYPAPTAVEPAIKAYAR